MNQFMRHAATLGCVFKQGLADGDSFEKCTVRNHRVAFVFARFLVLRGAEFTPISHQIHTGIRTEIAPVSHRSLGELRCWLGLLEVFPDELAIGAEDHLHVLVPQLAGHVPRIGACSQHG